MRAVRQQRAERDDHGDVQFRRQAENLPSELLPAHVRLDALDQHHIPRKQGHSRQVDARGGPLQLSNACGVNADVWTIDLIVVVVLRVELSDQFRTPHLA